MFSSFSIQLSKIKAKMDEKGVKFDENEDEFKIHTKLEAFLEEYFNDERMPPASYFNLTTTVDKFITYLKCDQSWLSEEDKFKECEEIPIIESMHYNGKCFTLFHNLSTEAIGQELGIKRRNALMRDPKSTLEVFIKRGENDKDTTNSYDFKPNEMIKLMIDFQPNETTNFYKYFGGKIFIHDNRHMPGMEEKYFEIEPGYNYEFYVRRISTKLLPTPYPTNCTDYYRKGRRAIEDSKWFSAPLNREECMRQCLIVVGMTVCRGVFPPEAPYFARNDYDKYKGTNGLRWGQWRANPPLTMFYTPCSFNYQMKCSEKCGFECEKDSYQVIMEKSPWPYMEITDSATEEEKARMEVRRKTSAFISIRYSTFTQLMRDFEPRFHSTELFICNVGGLVTMWIGICMIDLFDILESVVRRIMAVRC